MKRTLTLLVSLAATSAAFGNLVQNGDFEVGNTGFTTDYVYVAPLGAVHPQQKYTVHTDPADVHSGWVSYGDHTSGTGNMLIANGATVADQTVWQQTVSVNPNTIYVFSYWLSSTYSQPPHQLASLQTSINGSPIGTGTAPSTPASWQQVSHSWNSGARGFLAAPTITTFSAGHWRA